jgi:hypothetical protein
VRFRHARHLARAHDVAEDGGGTGTAEFNSPFLHRKMNQRIG